eukprot:11201642-Lingulodinium_polyedra.AAC.1
MFRHLADCVKQRHCRRPARAEAYDCVGHALETISIVGPPTPMSLKERSVATMAKMSPDKRKVMDGLRQMPAKQAPQRCGAAGSRDPRP